MSIAVCISECVEASLPGLNVVFEDRPLPDVLDVRISIVGGKG